MPFAKGSAAAELYLRNAAEAAATFLRTYYLHNEIKKKDGWGLLGFFFLIEYLMKHLPFDCCLLEAMWQNFDGLLAISPTWRLYLLYAFCDFELVFILKNQEIIENVLIYNLFNKRFNIYLEAYR